MNRSIKDRFKELAQVQNADASIPVDGKDSDVPPQFKEVFDKVFKIRNWIGNIRNNTNKIKDVIQANACFSTKSIYDQIETKVNETLDISFKITNELKALDVKNFKKNDSDKAVLARIKRIQYGSLRQDFQNALFEHNEFLERYREQKRIILKRQAALVNSDLDNKTLDRLLDDSECIHLFTDNILLNTREAKEQLNQIEERHAELSKIEKLITNVNEQFKQIAVLVEQQQDNINRIEYFAKDATNYVDQGLLELQNARENKKKARKRIFYIVIVFLIIITIAFLLLILL